MRTDNRLIKNKIFMDSYVLERRKWRKRRGKRRKRRRKRRKMLSEKE